MRNNYTKPFISRANLLITDLIDFWSGNLSFNHKCNAMQLNVLKGCIEYTIYVDNFYWYIKFIHVLLDLKHPITIIACFIVANIWSFNSISNIISSAHRCEWFLERKRRLVNTSVLFCLLLKF